MNIIQIKRIQEEIVRYIIEFYDQEWNIVVYNVEIVRDDSTHMYDILLLTFTKSGNEWQRNSQKYGPRECSNLYGDLWQAFDDKNRWSSFTLEIWKSGKYSFEFHYGPPPRITMINNGALPTGKEFEYAPTDEEE